MIIDTHTHQEVALPEGYIAMAFSNSGRYCLLVGNPSNEADKEGDKKEKKQQKGDDSEEDNKEQQKSEQEQEMGGCLMWNEGRFLDMCSVTALMVILLFSMVNDLIFMVDFENYQKRNM